MKKLKYEIPQTTRFQIEMEGAFCAGSGDKVITDDNGYVEIKNQASDLDFEIGGGD